jgi:hypothetical protein
MSAQDLYLVLVVTAFASFGVVLFAVSTWLRMK